MSSLLKNKRNSMNLNDRFSSDSFKKASRLVFEIEDIIKNELEGLEKFISGDNYDVPFQSVMNKAKRKLEKRRGPLLIKPLNKKKSRIVLSDMEYDPIKQIWQGNEKEMNSFPSTPGLITQINPNNLKHFNSQMEWDSNNGQWKGNEGELSKFKSMKPALITQLNGNLNMKTENGMVYDPVSMKWKGNEDDLDAFDAMDEQNKDSAFTVGKEFEIKASLLAIYKGCEDAHHADLDGWFPEERKLDDKDYLYSIRNMSIVKLIQTAIYGTPGGNSNKSGTNIPPPSSPGGLIPLLNGNKPKVTDETKSWDDVDFDDKPVLKLNLKVHQDSQDTFGSGDNMSVNSGGNDDESDWDKEMGFTSEDDTVGGGSSINTPRRNDEWGDTSGFNDSLGGGSSNPVGKIVQLNKFKEKSNDSQSDDDDDLDWDSFNNSNSNNTNTNNSSSNLNNIKPSTSSGSIGIYSKGTIKALEKGGSLKIRGNMNTIPLSQVFNNSNNSNTSSTTPLSSSGSHKFGGGGSIKSGGKANSVKSDSDQLETDSFYDDVEVPKGSVLSLHKDHIHNDDFNKLMMSGDEPHNETIKFFERVNDKDVFEEDWPEVQFPFKFGETVNNNNSELRKSPPMSRNQVEDYSEDIEIQDTTRPLTLKKPVLLADNPFGDDDTDDWSNDISFPVNFRPSTPSNNNSNNNNNNRSPNKNLTPNANYNVSNSTIKPNSLFNLNTPNKSTTTTTTTTTSTSTTTPKKPNLNLTVPTTPDDFRPLSPNSRNAALKTPEDNSPKTPYKILSRTKTDPIKMGLGNDTI